MYLQITVKQSTITQDVLVFLFSFLIFVICAFFCGGAPVAYEVSRLGLRSCSCWAASTTYTTAQGNARSITH